MPLPNLRRENAMIWFNQVSFAYHKNKHAIDGLSLHVPAGQTLGLLGHNGAGKTTLLRLALGLLRPQAGTLRVGSLDPQQGSPPRGLIAYVPEWVGTYDKLTAFQNLEFRARAARLDPSRIAEQSETWLRRFGLFARAGEQVGYWSKGMKQRLSLACALIAAPEILLLDEPTSGLDPESRALFKAILREVQPNLAATIICSHDLDFVYTLCNRITILQYGREVLSGPLPPTVEALTQVYLQHTAGIHLQQE